MRYHYEEKAELKGRAIEHACICVCDHPLYTACTLFQMGKRGLAVVQQYFRDKCTFWGPVYTKGLTNDIFLNENFYRYMRENADKPDENGLYPTVTVRKLMWALRMKPLKKERWETTFDRRWL